MQKILHFQAITGISPNQNKDLTSTYSQTQKSKEEHIETNIKYCKTCDLKTTEQDKTLPIMYWLPKMYKTPIGARFIVASKNCSTKPLPYIISKVFKMVFNHVESFYRKSLFYMSFKKFWVLENSFTVVTKLNKINTRKKCQNFRLYHDIYKNSS